MPLTVWFLLCIFGIAFGEGRSNVTPNLTPKCALTDPNFLRCLKQAVDTLRPNLVHGLPEFNIPPLEPFLVPPFSLTRNVSTVATYDVVVRDFFFSGASNFEILDYHVDPDSLTLRIEAGVPRLSLAAVNTGTGSIFGTPFHGTGRTFATIIDLIVDVSLKGGKYNRDGKFYVQWKIDSTKIRYKDFIISIQDIYPEPVASIISQRVSQNHDLFESHVMPVLKYSLEPYILNVLNKIHEKHPFNVLYPKV